MNKSLTILLILLVGSSTILKAQIPILYTNDSLQAVIINGKLGVGVQTLPNLIGGIPIANFHLYVKGGILTEEIRVRTDWADYVYEPDYNLMPLGALSEYIDQNRHLPNVPSATTIEKNGISVGEICKIQQEKIEELSLYIIQLYNRLEKIEKNNSN